MAHCVVTGGADGIGRALAQRYARAGHAVTVVDRDRARGEELCASLGAALVVADLGDPAGVAAAIGDLAARAPIGCLIHSAGISAVGPFADSDIDEQRRVLAVNLRAPIVLTSGLLGHLAPRATLIFIASLSAFTGYPGAAVYAASKDGLASYARSLRVALRPSGAHVLCVYPGPTRTAHARRYSPDNRREARRMAPERLADLIYAAAERRQRELVPGAASRLFALAGALLPALAEELMRRTVYMPLLAQRERRTHER